MTEVQTKKQPAGLLRRLGAFFYDFLLLLAVWFFATIPVLSINKGEAVAPADPYFLIYLFAVAFVFFGWFWTHGGQTLGMRAWKIRVEQLDGKNISWWQALHRFFLILLTFGLGIFWCLIGKDKQAFYDRLAGTQVVIVDKKFVPQ